ncbi:hypothetical protein ASE13_16160 [Sphingomonas sp. Root241]|nr:hypothetical protein ASE13_16160 [Sphingomonas sp. Root241]
MITRWTTQAGREPPAFAPERARLDPRGLPELLADIARLAADIPFHDDTGAVEGNWRRILLADRSFVLALLATADIDARAEPLTALLEQARGIGNSREHERRLTELVEALLRFADDLDDWLGPANLGEATEGRSIRRLAEDAVESVLGPQLQRLFDEVVAGEVELGEHFHHHHWDTPRPWRRAVIEGEIHGVAEAVERAWAGRMLEALADAVERFLDEMRECEKRANMAFKTTLHAGDHSAHPALVIAFAQMSLHARNLLNAVPQRLIDFYQQELLHAAPARSQPDRMLVAVEPKPGTRPILAKGTLLSAGKDANGRGIAFATDAPLAVTGAVLREARLWWPENGGVTLHRMTPGPDGRLGDAATGIAAPPPGEPFEANAIFSTPLLDLAGGTRHVELELDLGGVDMTGAELRLCVSTAQGWLPILSPDCSFDMGTLTVSFTLPPDFPPLAPCPEIADAILQPALRLTLVTGKLAEAHVADARLRIAIKDLPDLKIRTPAGPASASAAAPFGAPPWPGGWLRVDHPVLAGPPLDRLVLRFDWAGLPPGDGGFADYYRGYVVDGQGQLFDFPPFDNAAFAVTLAAPVHGWDAAQRLPLFAPASLGIAPPVPAAPPPNIFAAEFEPAPPLMPERGPLALGSWLAATASDGGEPLPDHICVTLATPTYGFGHSLHAANVQYATEMIARSDAPLPTRPSFLRRLFAVIVALPGKLFKKIEGIEAEPAAPEPEPEPVVVLLPNPPFQPLLSGIALDYARSLGADALTLHHAATLDSPVELPIVGAPLFPVGPTMPTLDLYFEGARADDVLALLVQLAASDAGDFSPGYRYRTADDWAPLPSRALLADETNGFTATGILRIAVPADAAQPFGLRLTFANDATTPPAILAILPDAVPATRLIHGTETEMPPVPAGTVTKLPGMMRVVQPLDTAGGQPPEPPAMLRARTAERVRHRGRALAAWDIERLVLSEFPDVAQVRVFPEGDPARQATAANVTVVVTAAGGATKVSRQLREAIADRLAQISSPFARTSVVDPVAIPIHVSARLILADADPGPVEAALASFLSPGAEPGLDLADGAGIDRVRAGIAEFLLRLPQVCALDRVTVALGDAPPGWHMAVPGAIEVTGVAAMASASW